MRTRKRSTSYWYVADLANLSGERRRLGSVTWGVGVDVDVGGSSAKIERVAVSPFVPPSPPHPKWATATSLPSTSDERAAPCIRIHSIMPGAPPMTPPRLPSRVQMCMSLHSTTWFCTCTVTSTSLIHTLSSSLLCLSAWLQVSHFEYAQRIRSTTFCCLSNPLRTSTSSSTSTKKSWNMRRGKMPLAACLSKCTSQSNSP